ncbi:MAG TPA: [protein-PII] uridylyltransferase, partial [Actinomycetota bacterium]|nr:[protein-PII] uridylyltransferase [Actinomycetota bacterium]
LFYALWDAGFKVGHAMRTVKESLRLAKDNLEAETSFLQPRLVAGDESLFRDFEEAAVAQTRKRASAFVDGVRAMMRARHLTGGSATSQLEPNLKDGTGGLRDLHVLGWFARVFDDDLVPSRDRAQLDAAAEMMHRVRNHLHYSADLPNDVLLFQYQRSTAQFLCYLDGERPAEDAFMRDLFTATRAVEHVVTAVVADVSARASGRRRRTITDDHFAVEDGRVVVLRSPDLVAQPERALEIFTLGAPVGAAALAWLHEAVEAVPELAWTDAVRRAFIRLLRQGDPTALEAADHAGVFGKLLPEWDRVRCQPQHNVYHGFTVDAHLFETTAHVAALGADLSDALVRDVFADVSDPDTLLLAGLLHDVGKGGNDDHSVRGERVALGMLDRMGVPEPRRSMIAWLVRHHLLLVEAATRRDLNDENFIVDVATRIGDAERARMLFLLSVADGRATGPTAWSPWKAGLVAELFTKVIHIIERGELVSTDAIDLARLRTGDLRTGLQRYPGDAVERHIDGMSRGYILAFPTPTLIRHFALMSEPLEQADVRQHVAETGEPGVYEYTVVAHDRPGLFSKVSGALALNGVNIVTAQGHSRADGLAVDVFRCVGAFERAIEAARWERVGEDLRKALRGKISLEVRLNDKRRAYGTKVSKGKREAPKVIVDNDTSDFLTVVEVHARDRVGLLFDITNAFTDLAVDIQVAKVATYGEDIVDVFYVRDLDGQKITDPEQLAEIQRALALRLDA